MTAIAILLISLYFVVAAIAFAILQEDYKWSGRLPNAIAAAIWPIGVLLYGILTLLDEIEL